MPTLSTSGLNEDEAVADYLVAAGESSLDPRVIAEQNDSRIDRSGGDTGSSRMAGFPIIPVLILLIVIAAGLGGWRIYRDRSATTPGEAGCNRRGDKFPSAPCQHDCGSNRCWRLQHRWSESGRCVRAQLPRPTVLQVQDCSGKQFYRARSQGPASSSSSATSSTTPSVTGDGTPIGQHKARRGCCRKSATNCPTKIAAPTRSAV